MGTTRTWLRTLLVLAALSPGVSGVAQELVQAVPTEAWAPGASALVVTPLPPTDAAPLPEFGELSVPGEGVRLDESIMPIASYFQVGGSGTPAAANPSTR